MRSEEAKEALKEFEDFCWGYSHKSPLYVTRSQWEKIKANPPAGDYIITEDA